MEDILILEKLIVVIIAVLYDKLFNNKNCAIPQIMLSCLVNQYLQVVI